MSIKLNIINMPWYKIEKPEELDNLVFKGKLLRYRGYPEYTYCNASWFNNMSFSITYKRIMAGQVEYREQPNVRFLNKTFRETKNCNFHMWEHLNPDIIVFNPISKADYINNREIYKLLVEKYQCVILGDDEVYKFKEDCFHIPIFKTKQELIKYLNKQ